MMTAEESTIVQALITALEQALSVWHDAPHYPTPKASEATAALARAILKAAKALVL